MTRTFQEISDAIEEINLDPNTKNAFDFLSSAFADDESYEEEVDAVEALTDVLYNEKADIISIIKAVTGQQTGYLWVVVARLDGDETIIFSQQVLAVSKKEAEVKVIAYLEQRNRSLEGQFELEYTHGPF